MASNSRGVVMDANDESGARRKPEGKYKAMAICFILGIGSLVSWNSMLTIGDYYYTLFPLDLATAGKGGIGPYIGICLLAACFGIADAQVEGGMVGDLCFMSPEFIQSYLAGLAASGALISILRMLTKVAFEKSNDGLRKGAILFLAISTFIEFVCIILYAICFTKLPIVKYYRSKAASEGSKTVSADLAAAGIQTKTNGQGEYDNKQHERLSNKQLFRENLDYAADLYPIVLIAMYNVVDFIARYIPLVPWLKLESRKVLLIAVLSRFLLIPAFYFTAKYGDQGWMILLTSFLGLTNGYLTVCVLTVAPRGYKFPFN
ncbi:Equilibrative nucleotide transporter 3, partial [Mucuna pruriens]